MKKLVALLLAVLMVFGLMTTAFAAEGELTGKTVILHTNDVHGAVEGYAYIKALKAEYEAKGAEVILVDAGDYSQGTTYVSTTKGADAVTMMNAVGYDVVTLGNHEFDYGYAQLAENMSKAKFAVICSNVYNADGTTIFDANFTYTTKSGLKVGFFGMETPETQTKTNPALIKGLKFDIDIKGAAEKQVAALSDADLVVCLSHLGVDAESEPYRSTDLYAEVSGIDFVIDGHSHTVMTKGEKGEPIQSTGTAFANIGVIVIDDATKTIVDNYLVEMKEDSAKDETVAAAAKVIVDRVNKEYGVKFATSKVTLNGAKAPNGNRDSETNNGDLITDAMVWKVLQNKDGLTVNEDHVVGITNGGGIRAAIEPGDVTKKDINTVLPFGNTVAVVYITGEQLLEALEASTYCTPGSVGGFPQVSGINFTLRTDKAYDANPETYPGSTYYGPASINRVTINSINGKPFAANEIYAVVTNNFCAAGGDTYYAFAAASAQFDTGVPLDEAVMEYVTKKLGGVIGAQYAAPQGRITIRGAYDDVPTTAWYSKAVDHVTKQGLMNGYGESFKPTDNTSRAMLVTVLYRMAGSPAVEGKVSETFKDCSDTAYYANAVLWASQNGIVNGYGDTYRPDQAVTRQEMAKILYGYDKVMQKTADTASVELTYTDLDSVASWALEGVNYCTAVGYLSGSNNAFSPKGNATRAMTAQVLTNMSTEKAA